MEEMARKWWLGKGENQLPKGEGGGSLGGINQFPRGGKCRESLNEKMSANSSSGENWF